MTERRPQDVNVENFVRENASLIARHAEENPNSSKPYGRIYKCKDCDKEYNTFQALGGHRASHRSTRPATGDDNSALSGEPGEETKLHVCRICGKRFAIGQELGGHMRKHWREKNSDQNLEDEGNAGVVGYKSNVDSSSSSSIASNSKGKEVFEYDLNLTPYENEVMIEVRSREQDFLEPL